MQSSPEQSVASARASVVLYDCGLKKWVPSGGVSCVAKVHIYHHAENNTFRVVGRKVQDHEVVINRSILKGLKYFQATPTFHQWRDSTQIHGLNFASREDAETFALAMERVLDILGHSSMYLSNNRSSRAQPLYQTIGHSGVSLDDYAEYRGWMNHENGERKQSSDYGIYRTAHGNYSSHPNTPSPSAFSHHRASSVPPSTSHQQLSIMIPNQQQSSPQSAAPPPPPPPPPTSSPSSSNSRLSGMATLPRLHIKTDSEEEMTETSLTMAIAAAKLKKTQTKVNEGNEAKNFPVKGGMSCMMDEMTRTLARRRAQTDSNLDDSTGSIDRNFNRQASLGASSPNRSSGGDSPLSLRRLENEGENSRGGGQVVVDLCQIQRMKQDLVNEVKAEMNKIKQDIIEAIRMEMNRR